jgi:3-hydroxyisobutyrate dehydrogenase-like beta-hydroxyacid dehydrogenase
LVAVGLQGTALAERLLSASYSVRGYDVDVSRCESLERIGGTVAADPADVAARCDRAMLSLSTSDVGETVVGEMDAALRCG